MNVTFVPNIERTCKSHCVWEKYVTRRKWRKCQQYWMEQYNRELCD